MDLKFVGAYIAFTGGGGSSVTVGHDNPLSPALQSFDIAFNLPDIYANDQRSSMICKTLSDILLYGWE